MKLSKLEYFEVLQREALICGVRGATYPEPYNKYWIRAQRKKRGNIESLQTHFLIKSIFESEETLESTFNSLVPEFGLPSYFYHNSEDRAKQRFWDIVNYYSKGVRVKLEDGVVFGTVVNISLSRDEALVKIEDRKVKCSFHILGHPTLTYKDIIF